MRIDLYVERLKEAEGDESLITNVIEDVFEAGRSEGLAEAAFRAESGDDGYTIDRDPADEDLDGPW